MKATTFARKKLVLALTVVAVAALFALTGCSASGSNDEVLQKLDSMQTQLDDMDARMNEYHADDQAPAGESQPADSSPEAQPVNSSSDFQGKLDELTASVEDAVATAAAVTVPSAAADRPGAYYDAIAPLEELDLQLDKLDDALEAAYRDGSLTQQEFWTLEKAASQLEDQLDRAEEDLEQRMGVDD